MSSELFSEGDYEGTVDGGVYKESAQKGTPFMEVMFDIQGHKRPVAFYLSEKAEASSLERLRALGWNGEFEDAKFLNPGPHRLTCKHEPGYKDQSKLQEKWSYWGPPRTPNKDFARTLAAKYKQSAPPPLAKPVTKPAPPPPKPSTPPPPMVPIQEPTTILAKTEGEAWDYWVKKIPEDAVRNERWLDNRKLYPPDPLTAEQWNKIAHEADLPF